MSNRFGITIAVLCGAFLGSAIAEVGIWQDRPLQCNSCPKNKCDDLPGNATICSNTEDLCHTVFKDGKVISRGCSSAVAKEMDDYCIKNKDECFSCSSNKCNMATDKKDYIDCISCDSFYNPLCVTNPKSITETKKCYKSCMVALYPSTAEAEPTYELIRGCLDDKDELDRQSCELGTKNCKSCTGGKCNNHNLPEDRLKCYDCRRLDCKTAEPSVCLGYNKKDQCTYLLDSMGNIDSAQCKSKLQAGSLPQLMLRNQLVVCNGDACNKIDNFPKPQNCIKCSSVENPLCATDPSQVSTTVHCANVPNTHCSTQVRDGITIRGCANDMDVLDRIQCNLRKSDYCETCLGEKCNNEVFPKNRRHCFRCSSSDDKNCEADPKQASVCPKFVDGDSCVVQFSDKKITRRGCLSELPCVVKDNKKCRICADNDCNSVNLKKENSAAGIYVAVGSLLVMTTHIFL